MFRIVLIANRGEIACRIARTCRRLGVRTVAVYSDADRDALHVRTADEAVRIGPPEAGRSYLDVDVIVAAARACGADAVHPGYGFLSERAVFPRRLAEAGIGWIGPHAEAIERMGSKRDAKALARLAGVACVPGYDGEDQSDRVLAEAAARIGFPVLVKASAGGGGRGMRRVDLPEDLPAALAAARAEAQSAFGSAELLLEKLLLRPRHLEVQLAGDRHGNLVHLFERECSVQRNYQKLLEEAPAPRLGDAIRSHLHGAALRLGRAIGYDSLGTVEFILEDGMEEPWFLEMNTRLQVEHPVTECVTGLDLVEWQIRAAAGETLPLTQNDISLRGHAIEARLCAEDPARDYQPGTGTVLRFDPPHGDGVRVDTGVGTGSVVTPHYDSLLAKLVAHGATRGEALDRLARAIDGLVVLGVATNQAFLGDVLAQPAFQRGQLTTRFLAEAFAAGWREDGEGDNQGAWAEMAAVALWLADAKASAAGPGPWGTLGPFRVLAPAGRQARTCLDLVGLGGARAIEVCGDAARFEAEGRPVAADTRPSMISVTVDGVTRGFAWAKQGDDIWLQAGRRAFRARVAAAGSSMIGAAAEAGGSSVVAAMPGLVSGVEIEEGQIIEKGQVCVVMEAMKVVLRLPAPVTGRVARLLCAPGDTVTAGAVLVEIKAAQGDATQPLGTEPSMYRLR